MNVSTGSQTGRTGQEEPATAAACTQPMDRMGLGLMTMEVELLAATHSWPRNDKGTSKRKGEARGPSLRAGLCGLFISNCEAVAEMGNQETGRGDVHGNKREKTCVSRKEKGDDTLPAGE